MNSKEIMNAARHFQEMNEPIVLPALCEVKDKNGKRLSGFTMQFETVWRTCTDDFGPEEWRCVACRPTHVVHQKSCNVNTHLLEFNASNSPDGILIGGKGWFTEPVCCK